MKKTLVTVIVSIALIASITGCSKNADLKANKQTAKPAAASTVTAQEKTTIKDLSKLDDSKLIEQVTSGEQELKIDEADSSAEDLDAIDDILNDKDPIADIPANVKVDK